MMFEFSANDIRIMVDAFVAIMATEVVVKPIAIRLGRGVLSWVDSHIGWLPNWLHGGDQ
jgi:hypothetical protein